MSSLKSLLKMIEAEKIEFVDFKIVDFFGHWRHLTIPVSNFNESILEEGIGFDGSNYGYRSVNCSDMLFKPDLSTAKIDIFFANKTLSLIGNIYEAGKEVTRFIQDPRAVAERTEAAVRQSGIADQINILPEFEFYIFDTARFESNIQHGYYFLDSEQAFWNTGSETAKGFIPPRKGGYHLTPPGDSLADLRNEITAYLEANGVPVKYHHHEVGGAGQQELETNFGQLLEMADNTLFIKYVVKNMAARYGKTATFMPKCLYNEAGNGMHVHQFLTRKGINIFHEESGYEKLSDTALYYIGGILHHANSLCAFTNASTNSYRRLVPGFEAPVNRFFAAANRSAAVRIPTYVRNPAYRRIEYRPIDAAGNPYLAYSAMIMAGLDGIINKIDPWENGYGPCEGNFAEKEKNQIKKLPLTLREALEALEEDHDYLLRDGVFTKELIENWVETKLHKEVLAVNERPHPYEFMLYYDL